jgi:hypothetical protein
MNKDNNHINSWSDADIRKYGKGELSARQMHDLERAALDDPFLADALEGLGAATADPSGKAPSVDADMDELRTRLAARVEKDEKKEPAPVVWFKRRSFRAAAAIILLLGLGLTFYYNFIHGRSMYSPDIVATSTGKQAARPTGPGEAPASPAEAPARPDASSARSDASSARPAGSSAIPAGSSTRSTSPAADSAQPSTAAAAPFQTSCPALVTPDRSYARAKKKAAANQRHSAGDQPHAAADRPQTATERSQTAANQPQTAAGQPQIAASKPAPDTLYAAVTRDAPRQPLSFSGRVVDLNNHPLGGAFLFSNGIPRIGTKTDAAGNFNFKVPLLDTLQRMTVTKDGYEEADVSLNSNSQTNNVIRLRQDTRSTLDEVLITGYGAKRKETYATAPLTDNGERLDSAWQKVVPIVGKLAYEQYLDTAKRSLKVDTAIHGIEQVSFQVDEKGQITEFKIEQSLSSAHDAGVIQLISSGPAWKLLHGKKARAVVHLSFP